MILIIDNYVVNNQMLYRYIYLYDLSLNTM